MGRGDFDINREGYSYDAKHILLVIISYTTRLKGLVFLTISFRAGLQDFVQAATDKDSIEHSQSQDFKLIVNELYTSFSYFVVTQHAFLDFDLSGR